MLDNDEYGNPRSGQPAVRYNWLGGKQRSSETLTGLFLMGIRLYNPQTGRFLQQDPVMSAPTGGYDYAGQDPRNGADDSGAYRHMRYSFGWFQFNVWFDIDQKRFGFWVVGGV